MYTQYDKYQAIIGILETYKALQEEITKEYKKGYDSSKLNINSLVEAMQYITARNEVARAEAIISDLDQMLTDYDKKIEDNMYKSNSDEPFDYIPLARGEQIKKNQEQLESLFKRTEVMYANQDKIKAKLNEQLLNYEQNHQYGYMILFVAESLFKRQGFPIRLLATMDYQEFYEQKEQALAATLSPLDTIYNDILISALPFSTKYQELAQSKRYTR